MTSTTSPAGRACEVSWISVRIGKPVRDLTSASARRPASRPGPRNDDRDVRFALSYDALKIKDTPQRAVISLSAVARSSAWVALSMTQGPAISASGCPPPIAKPPMWTGLTTLFYRFAPLPISRRYLRGFQPSRLVPVGRVHEAREE